MTIKQAKSVLEKNYTGLKGSIMWDICENETFSESAFWEFYDCLIMLVKDSIETGNRDLETAYKMSHVYQWLLTELIFNFNPNDPLNIKNFPDKPDWYEYTYYLERIDDAIAGYYRGALPDESHYKLKRPENLK